MDKDGREQRATRTSVLHLLSLRYPSRQLPLLLGSEVGVGVEGWLSYFSASCGARNLPEGCPCPNYSDPWL